MAAAPHSSGLACTCSPALLAIRTAAGNFFGTRIRICKTHPGARSAEHLRVQTSVAKRLRLSPASLPILSSASHSSHGNMGFMLRPYRRIRVPSTETPLRTTLRIPQQSYPSNRRRSRPFTIADMIGSGASSQREDFARAAHVNIHCRERHCPISPTNF